MFQEFAACRGDTIQGLLERRDNRSDDHWSATTVLGWKPTFNRFSKSDVGTIPTRQNLGWPDVTVNPMARVFPVFLKEGGTGGWPMAYGKSSEESVQSASSSIGRIPHFVPWPEFFPLWPSAMSESPSAPALWSDLHKFFSGCFRQIPLIDLLFWTVLPTISMGNRRIQPVVQTLRSRLARSGRPRTRKPASCVESSATSDIETSRTF